VQCLPAVLLSYGTRDGEGERWGTLGETAVVTERERERERLGRQTAKYSKTLEKSEKEVRNEG